MTTDKHPSSQTEEMAAIEAEVPKTVLNGNIYLSSVVRQLISTLPDIFDTEDAKEKKLIDVASQIITRYNYRRRSLSKQKIQSTAVSSKKHGYVMSVTVVFKFHIIFKIFDVELMAFLTANQRRFEKRTKKGEKTEGERYH